MQCSGPQPARGEVARWYSQQVRLPPLSETNRFRAANAAGAGQLPGRAVKSHANLLWNLTTKRSWEHKRLNWIDHVVQWTRLMGLASVPQHKGGMARSISVAKTLLTSNQPQLRPLATLGAASRPSNPWAFP